jgi:hypothetical protein
MTDYAKLNTLELRCMAGVKAKNADQQLHKRQFWTKPQCIDYLLNDILPTNALCPAVKKSAPVIESSIIPFADSIPMPVEAVNLPLPVTVGTDSAVNPPLPAMKSKKNHKGMMPNGRTAKGVPDFKNWFGRVYPVDFAYPAWKSLSKTATDVANICRAKRDHAANCNKKDSSGVPVFIFPFSEAVNTFKISRPTFDKSIKQLVEIGFLEYSSHGGIFNGQGVSAKYRLSEKWKTWSPDRNKAPKSDDRKKLDALATNQKPSKPVLQQPVNLPLPVETETG